MIQKLLGYYRRIPKRVTSVLFIIAVVVFLVLYLKDTDFGRLRHLHIDWWLLLAASAWTLAFRYWMVLIWRVILRALGSEHLPPFRVMSYVYAKAWLSRYIPGTVTWIAARIYMASSYGISKSRLMVSSLLEGAMQVAASTIVSMIILGLNPHFDLVPLVAKVLVVIVSIISLVVLFPPIFNRLMYIAFSVFKRQPNRDLHINGKAVGWSFVLFAIGTFINGTGAFLLILSIDPTTSLATYLYIIGAFGISGAIGIAVPFLPSGLGVRDGILLVLLAAIMPKEVALVVTVFSRLWLMAIDVLFLGAAAGVKHLKADDHPEKV